MKKSKPIDVKTHVKSIEGFKGPVIEGFFDEHFFLSNFYPSPIVVEGVDFKTSEHAYQALKLDDRDMMMDVAGQSTPEKAKKRLHEIFRLHKLEHPCLPRLIMIMEKCVEAKFSKGSKLASMLENTDPALLVEGNWWGDAKWGVFKGEGMNLLGKVLMRRRIVLLQRTIHSWESPYLYPDFEF